MIRYYERDATKPDKRCQICKNHKYVIVSNLRENPNPMFILHTYLGVEEWGIPANIIHSWTPRQVDKLPTNCLESYKEVK